MNWLWKKQVEDRLEFLEHCREQERYPLAKKLGLSAHKVTTFYKHQYAFHAIELEHLLRELEKREIAIDDSFNYWKCK